ncbi:alcohol dehydrogenase catalytic domain-containing protein, partial [Streptomyces virginiae]|uniref:SpnB-like Rossmann fold domain-containing protein n=1 Tax=Streptomyces virginiae TaxID=1961 RepID=UPI0035E2D1BB
TDTTGFGLHPALLDAALHATTLAGDTAEDSEDGLLLPFSWSGVSLFASDASALRVHIRPAGRNSMAISLADQSGAPVASVDSLALRAVSADRLSAGSGSGVSHDALFRAEWTGIALPAEVPPPSWAVVGSGLPGLTGAPVFADLAALGDDVPPHVLLPLPAPARGPLTAQVHEALLSALELVQSWLAEDRFADSRLVLVTQGAVSPEPGIRIGDLAQSPVWGLVRSAQAENPDRLVLVDLDGTPASLAVLPAALATGEPELALHGGEIRARRLIRVSEQHALVPPQDGPWRLDVSASGTLENLSLVPAPDAAGPLGEGEVRVHVRAAGLNFRDVVTALGMVVVDEIMGGEAAGVVAEVGPGVTDLAVGDRVVGLFTGSFGPLAVTHRDYLAPMPAGWS